MTLSLFGPTNNRWGPGLTFTVTCDHVGTPTVGEQYIAEFFRGANPVSSEFIAVAAATVTTLHNSSLVIGLSPQLQSRFRSGASVTDEVHVRIRHINTAGADLEPALISAALTWDSSLQLQVLIESYSGSATGGLTPEQDQRLKDIAAFVSQVYTNSP